MKLDPTKMKNWEIAEAAEKNIKSIFQLADEIGLKQDELLPAGHTLGKVNFAKVLDRLKDAPTAKYIDVTAITPTPFGEGKTTTTIGLIQGLAKCGKRPTGAIRQPSAGPTFNVKGGAAGGGLGCSTKETMTMSGWPKEIFAGSISTPTPYKSAGRLTFVPSRCEI
jgi:formate--tetrahydrofolate ligase